MKNSLLKIAAFLALGIGIADAFEYHSLMFSQYIYLGIILFCLFLMLMLNRAPSSLRGIGKKTLFACLALLTFSFIGGWRYQQVHDKVTTDWPNEEILYKGKIIEGPSERKKTLRYVMQVEGKTIYAYFPKTVTYEAGDELQLKTRIKAPENFEGADFDYARFLYHRRIAGTAPFVKESAILPAEEGKKEGHLSSFFPSLRKTLRRRYECFGFKDNELGIITALSLGDKSLLSDEQREVFSASGASHVLALSGLHVGIIYFLLSLLLGRKRGARRGRFVKEALIVLSLWLFAFLTGMSPSITRAVTMCTIFALVQMMGGRRSSIDALFLTAFVMLLVQPFLLFDASFQLSFGAMLGILLVSEHTPRNVFLSIILLSFAAQLGTFPLVLHYFGVLPTYFLLTNLVIFPLIYVIMACIVLWWMVSWTPLAAWATTALGWLVSQMNHILSWIAALPGSQLAVGKISWLWVALLYLLVAILIIVIRRLRNNIRRYHAAFKTN